jgi:hypothetical protein
VDDEDEMFNDFHFETQTVECKYCRKRVGVDYQYRHLNHCESEEGQKNYEPWWDDYQTHLAPLYDAINGAKYGIAKHGEDAPLETIMDGRIGSFAQDRFENTIHESLARALRYLPLKNVLALLLQVNCPLCRKNPCQCRGEDEED